MRWSRTPKTRLIIRLPSRRAHRWAAGNMRYRIGAEVVRSGRVDNRDYGRVLSGAGCLGLRIGRLLSALRSVPLFRTPFAQHTGPHEKVVVMQQYWGMRWYGLLGSFLVVVALASGCASEIATVDSETVAVQPIDNSSLIVVPDGTGRFMTNTIVQCGGPPPFLAGALENPVLLGDSTVADGALDIFDGFVTGGEGAWWPQDGYWALTNNETELLLAHIGMQGEVTLIGSKRVDGSWRSTAIRGGGPCPIQVPLPAELHEVDWRVDPAQPLDESATTISLLATGQACSSGQPMGGRLREPQTLLTPDTVYFVLVADQPGGDQECPGNPEEAVVVDLGEPIGSRQLVNARVVSGSLGDYLPVSPCGHINPELLAGQDIADEPVALNGPPERTQC